MNSALPNSTLPTVVVAPDKFKGSLTASEAAAAIAAGIRDVLPEARIVELPIADGGDGTVDAAIAAGWQRVDVVAENAIGALAETYYAVRGDTAIVELAQVCGLAKLEGRLDPMGSGTEGLGAVIAHAMSRGVREVVIGLGGSASTDGGAGMLRSLGARTPGSRKPGGADLINAERLDRRDLHPALHDVSFVLAADVDNPLLGPRGAAAVFAPQKGATTEQVAKLEKALRHWAELVDPKVAGRPGAGAAGGTGFAAMAVLGARRQSGADMVLDLVAFDAALRGSALVITGEGALDAQTLDGKGPAGVARRAGMFEIPVVAVAGRNLLDDNQIRKAGFDRVYALAELESDLQKSIADAARLLREVGARIARDYLT